MKKAKAQSLNELHVHTISIPFYLKQLEMTYSSSSHRELHSLLFKARHLSEELAGLEKEKSNFALLIIGTQNRLACGHLLTSFTKKASIKIKQLHPKKGAPMVGLT